MPRSLSRRLLLGAASVALAGMVSAGASDGIQTAEAAGLPQATSSFYVYGSFIDVCGPGATSECPLYNNALTEAVPPGGGMTILDFGAPCFEPATLEWGTQLFNSQSCTPDSTLMVLARAWLRGFAANPNRSASPGYVLVAGTSNSLTAAIPGNALTGDQMAAHGQAWFTSVIRPLAAVDHNVTIWAGDDIEQSRDGNWYDGPSTVAWVDAYAAASGASKPCVPGRSGLMLNYGDYVPNEPGWSAAQVYHVSWQSPPACPMPEIYSPGNAAEWQSLNRYALGLGLPQLEFTGVLSQDGAGGSLAAGAGWSGLQDASGQSPAYLTVIGVTGAVPSLVPGPPTGLRAVAGPGMVTLLWSAPAWDGGTAVTTYTVTVYTRSLLVQQVKVTGFPAPETAVVEGLSKGRAYTFYVSATNRVGTGSLSLPSQRAIPSAPWSMR